MIKPQPKSPPTVISTLSRELHNLPFAILILLCSISLVARIYLLLQ